MVRLKEIAKLHQFLRIAREPSKLGENESLNVASLNVRHHPLGFRMVSYALPTNSREIVNLENLPASGERISLGPAPMILRAVPISLLFR
jgi:hypothetical protein